MIIDIKNAASLFFPTKLTIPIKMEIKDISPITTIAIPKLDKFIVFYVLYETALRFRGYDRGPEILYLS